MAAIRIAELNRLFRARHGEVLPDNETGRKAVFIAAQHLIQLAGHPQQRIMSWAALRAPWMTVAEVQEILATVATDPKTWKADTLAWQLGLTYADRQTLKITTIGAIDCNQAQRQAKRRMADKLRKRAARKARKIKDKKASAP